MHPIIIFIILFFENLNFNHDFVLITAPGKDQFRTNERIHHTTDITAIAPPLLIRARRVLPRPELGRLDLVPDLDPKPDLDLEAVLATEVRVEIGIRGPEAEVELLEIFFDQF